MGCAVGCGIEAVDARQPAAAASGRWEAGNRGLLCVTGRFDVVEPNRPRITQPLRAARMANWSRPRGMRPSARGRPNRQAERVAGLVSPRLPNESLAAFACFFQEVLRSDEVALLYGEDAADGPGHHGHLGRHRRGRLASIVIGGDPLRDQKVLGYLVRRAIDRRASHHRRRPARPAWTPMPSATFESGGYLARHRVAVRAAAAHVPPERQRP